MILPAQWVFELYSFIRLSLSDGQWYDSVPVSP